MQQAQPVNPAAQCIFCHIIAGRVASRKVYEDDKVVAILDINPANPGHILLLPKEHVAIMPQMSDELVAHIGMVSKQLSHALLRALKVQGTNIFIASGVAAGQRAGHFMLHIIPRTEDDGVGLTLPSMKMEESLFEHLLKRVKPFIAKQFGKKVEIPVELPPVEKIKEKSEEKVGKEKVVEEKEEKKEVKEEGKKEEEKEGKGKRLSLDEIAEFFAKK